MLVDQELFSWKIYLTCNNQSISTGTKVWNIYLIVKDVDVRCSFVGNDIIAYLYPSFYCLHNGDAGA